MVSSFTTLVMYNMGLYIIFIQYICLIRPWAIDHNFLEEVEKGREGGVGSSPTFSNLTIMKQLIYIIYHEVIAKY